MDAEPCIDLNVKKINTRKRYLVHKIFGYFYDANFRFCFPNYRVSLRIETAEFKASK